MSRVQECEYTEYWAHIDDLTDEEKEYLDSKGIEFDGDDNTSPTFECGGERDNWISEVEELLEEFNS